MSFAYPFPWWLALAVAAAAGTLAFLEYRRPLSPLTPLRRGVLVALRVTALVAVTLFIFRPTVMLPPSRTSAAVVPVLVDVSRSMRLADADGQTRLARATTLLKTELLPALSRQYVIELYSAGDGLAPATLGEWSADGRQSDLSGALDVRQRYRGRRVARDSPAVGRR